MNLQIIKSIDGRDEYVLLPVNIYKSLHDEIEARLNKVENQNDYVIFDPADYVDNPIALARINAGITQQQLAARMKVTQAYVAKIERQGKVTAKLLKKVKDALKSGDKKAA